MQWTWKVPASNDAMVVRNQKLYMAVGGTHALNLAEAMSRKGDVVDAVIIPGWKATSVGVKLLAERMKESVGRKKPDRIMLMLFDDNIYFGMCEDEAMQAPQVGDDGKEHVVGRLVVSKMDNQELLFRQMEPLWEATTGIEIVILTPAKLN
jgi:molybdopterin-guanine dinucleotide biosynthesis protein